MQLKKNDEIQLNITALTSEGSAIGRKDGVPIFVGGGLPAMGGRTSNFRI